MQIAATAPTSPGVKGCHPVKGSPKNPVGANESGVGKGLWGAGIAD